LEKRNTPKKPKRNIEKKRERDREKNQTNKHSCSKRAQSAFTKSRSETNNKEHACRRRRCLLMKTR